jgi:Ion channel
VGFGDIAPVTWQGKMVVSASILAGITIIPAQAALLVEALLQRTKETEQRRLEIEDRQRQMLEPVTHRDSRVAAVDFDSTNSHADVATLEVTKKCPTCNVGLHWSHATYCYNCAGPLNVDNELVLPEP